MKIKILFLAIYTIILLNCSNIFAAVQPPEMSGTARLYNAVLDDCDPKTKLQNLMLSGIDIDTEETDNEELRGFTALHVAAYNGNSKVIPILLDAGASKNKRVGEFNQKFAGLTALQIAIMCAFPNVVNELVKNHASTGPKDTTLFCFKRFLMNIYSKLQSEDLGNARSIKKTHMQASQQKVNEMATELIQAGFTFGEDTKSFVKQHFDINLN